MINLQGRDAYVSLKSCDILNLSLTDSKISGMKANNSNKNDAELTCLWSCL